jgi:ribose 5-phosphate isomerase A
LTIWPLTRCAIPYADDFPSIDITFDGADDVDRQLNAIKGGGACHLREKVVAERSEHFV